MDNLLIFSYSAVLVFLTAWAMLLRKRRRYPSSMFISILFLSASISLYNWNNPQELEAILDQNTTASIAFSPRQGSTDLVIKTIQRANQYIYVAAYYFTSKPIAQALVDARARGVEVKVVLDRSQKNARGSLLDYFKQKGISVRINSKYKIMHNKFMVIDANTVQLGSFNYTVSAEDKNAENVLVVNHDAKIVAAYLKQWHKLWDESI